MVYFGQTNEGRIVILVFNVTFRCRPGTREEYLEKLAAEGIIDACRGEAGNLGYAYYLAAGNDTDLLLIEKWQDLGAVMKHARQAHMARMDEIKAAYVTDMVIEKYEA